MVVCKPEKDTMTNKLISPSKAGRQMERRRVFVLHFTHREKAACLQGPAEFDRRATFFQCICFPLTHSQSPAQSNLHLAGATAVMAVMISF